MANQKLAVSEAKVVIPTLEDRTQVMGVLDKQQNFDLKCCFTTCTRC
ncbi:MAG: hypothetical protein AAB402_04380 [Patescibacteria group bacterium]